MRYAVAVHGTRGDVEPAAALALELIRRGHEIRMAVPPNLVEFAESAGIPAPVLSYGPDSQQQVQTEAFDQWWRLRNPATALGQAREYLTDGWAQMSQTLTATAADADLILTGTTYQEVAANVAECLGVPLAALHYFPTRPNSRILPVPLPMSVVRPAWAVAEWVRWRLLKPAEDEQRRSLGLPDARHRAARRIAEHGTLEIQAYDEVFFPGLSADFAGNRPLVGAMTLQLAGEADDGVEAWVVEGTAPVYFGFGSMPVADPGETVAMISEVCAELGQRALICSGAMEVGDLRADGPVKIVRSVNHAQIFPRCRAVVHHGGAGTTAAGVRAGVPTLVLWVGADQPVWAQAVQRLGVGTSRRFSASTAESLREDLQTVLSAHCAARARATAALTTPPEHSVAMTADLLEQAAAR